MSFKCSTTQKNISESIDSLTQKCVTSKWLTFTWFCQVTHSCVNESIDSLMFFCAVPRCHIRWTEDIYQPRVSSYYFYYFYYCSYHHHQALRTQFTDIRAPFQPSSVHTKIHKRKQVKRISFVLCYVKNLRSKIEDTRFYYTSIWFP